MFRIIQWLKLNKKISIILFIFFSIFIYFKQLYLLNMFMYIRIFYMNILHFYINQIIYLYFSFLDLIYFFQFKFLFYLGFYSFSYSFFKISFFVILFIFLYRKFISYYIKLLKNENIFIYQDWYKNFKGKTEDEINMKFGYTYISNEDADRFLDELFKRQNFDKVLIQTKTLILKPKVNYSGGSVEDFTKDVKIFLNVPSDSSQGTAKKKLNKKKHYFTKLESRFIITHITDNYRKDLYFYYLNKNEDKIIKQVELEKELSIYKEKYGFFIFQELLNKNDQKMATVVRMRQHVDSSEQNFDLISQVSEDKKKIDNSLNDNNDVGTKGKESIFSGAIKSGISSEERYEKFKDWYRSKLSNKK